jgi:hypothetical protein
MNLFLSRLFGKMWSTEKFDNVLEKSKKDLIRYQQVISTPEFKEMIELKKTIDSPEFQSKREQVISCKYKSTEEYATLKEFKSLSKSKQVVKYNNMLQNSSVMDFISFMQTSEAELLKNDTLVEEDAKLRKYRDLANSKMISQFRELEQHPKILRYQELKKIVEDKEWQKKNEFLANPNRWETTQEGEMEKRYKTLCAQDDILFYNKLDKETIEKWNNFEEIWVDNIENTNLADSVWKAGFSYNNKQLKNHHSYSNELQAYTQGNNVTRSNKIMSIHTRKQNQKGIAWDDTRGFIEKDFQFTSDVIQTSDTYKGTYYMAMVKARFVGKANHVISLNTGNKKPITILVQSIKNKLQVGLVEQQDKFELENIRGISASNWYYYSVVCTGKEFVWYVNNIEVLRTASTQGDLAYFMQALSFLPCEINNKKQSGDEGRIEIGFAGFFKNK